MKCAILCGGLATRLGETAAHTPKVLMPVGGKPLIEHLFSVIRDAGVRDVALLTGHLSDVIERHVGDGSTWNLCVQVRRESQPLGTAGAVKAAENLFVESGYSDDFFLLYGDVMLSMDLARMASFHRSKNALATLAVHPNDHPHDSDLVEMNDHGRIVAFHPKPHPQNCYFDNLVNAAAYVLSPELLRQIPSGTKLDFGRDVFPACINTGRIYGYPTAEYLKDLGTPERLARVNRDWQIGRIQNSHRSVPRGAIFLDRDGVINRDIGGIKSAEQLELLPGVTEAIRQINQSGSLAIVITNQPVLAKGWCTTDEMRRIHRKMSSLLGNEGAYLDAVYYCPHHPDRGFEGEVPELKIACQCRKPGIGLIEQAAGEFNIDLARSIMIGDSIADFQCARTAGLPAFGVKTGATWLASDPPDQEFADLKQAVETALKSISRPSGPVTSEQ